MSKKKISKCFLYSLHVSNLEQQFLRLFPWFSLFGDSVFCHIRIPISVSKVADPHHINADPQNCNADSNPDTSFYFNATTDPAPKKLCESKALLHSILSLPNIYYNAVPDTATQNNEDPDKMPCPQIYK